MQLVLPKSFHRRNLFQINLLIVFFAPALAFGQDTPDYYRANCMSCHTIGGGRLTGPDLKDVTKRKDPEWLIEFMMNPKAVIDSGDKYANDLKEASLGAVMPVVQGMTRYRAQKILELIEVESKLSESQFKGFKISTKPFTEADRIAGREIFIGVSKLTNGGASCISCHSMHDLSALGGGYLGPDLTNVFERLKDRIRLGSWLKAPMAETMQPIYKNHPLNEEEIHVLTAYFEDAAKHSKPEASVNRIALLLAGLALAAGIIFLFDVIWKGRFHSVRRPLVDMITRAIHQSPGNENGKSDPHTNLVSTETNSEYESNRGEH